jgi:hypothetical protein
MLFFFFLKQTSAVVVRFSVWVFGLFSSYLFLFFFFFFFFSLPIRKKKKGFKILPSKTERQGSYSSAMLVKKKFFDFSFFAKKKTFEGKRIKKPFEEK